MLGYIRREGEGKNTTGGGLDWLRYSSYTPRDNTHTQPHKHKSCILEVCGRRDAAERGLRRSKRRREEKGKEGRRGEAGGRRDDSPPMSRPRRRQTLNKSFDAPGGNMGGEE